MVRYLVLALAFLFLAAPNAGAATPPSYNIIAHCKEVAAVGGGSYVIESSCREMEAESKQNIQRMNVPGNVLRYCDEVARTTGGSYTILESCIEMEMEAKGKMGY